MQRFGMITVYLSICRADSFCSRILQENYRNGVNMGRRNVLGNKIEESKTMWIVLISLFVSILQFVIYYITDSSWVGLLLVGLCILLGGVGVHLITGELEELFSYLLIPCVCSGGAGILIPQLSGGLLPDSATVLLGCILAWLIPVVYACLCTWAEGSAALLQFSSFYKKTSVFFYLVYFGLLIYWFVAYNRIPAEDITVQWIPFATFAAYIDGMMSGTVSLERLFQFLAERILLFVPFGFFIAMAGRKLHSLLRLALVLAVPVLLELLQYVIKFNSCDADDAVFSFLGGLIGMLGFVVFNALFQKTTGKNFDGSEIERDYYGRRL